MFQPVISPPSQDNSSGSAEYICQGQDKNPIMVACEAHLFTRQHRSWQEDRSLAEEQFWKCLLQQEDKRTGWKDCLSNTRRLLLGVGKFALTLKQCHCWGTDTTGWPLGPLTQSAWPRVGPEGIETEALEHGGWAGRSSEAARGAAAAVAWSWLVLLRYCRTYPDCHSVSAGRQKGQVVRELGDGRALEEAVLS